MRRLSIFLLAVTISVWGYVGWKTVALASGRLGPVTVIWHNVQRPHTYFAWSPNVAAYQFNPDGLQLQPSEKATLLLKPPARFAGATLRIMADCGMAITLPGQPAREISGHLDYDNRPNRLNFRWSALNRVPSGYPVAIRNSCHDRLTIFAIKLTLRP